MTTFVPDSSWAYYQKKAPAKDPYKCKKDEKRIPAAWEQYSTTTIERGTIQPKVQKLEFTHINKEGTRRTRVVGPNGRTVPKWQERHLDAISHWQQSIVGAPYVTGRHWCAIEKSLRQKSTEPTEPTNLSKPTKPSKQSKPTKTPKSPKKKTPKRLIDRLLTKTRKTSQYIHKVNVSTTTPKGAR